MLTQPVTMISLGENHDNFEAFTYLRLRGAGSEVKGNICPELFSHFFLFPICVPDFVCFLRTWKTYLGISLIV